MGSQRLLAKMGSFSSLQATRTSTLLQSDQTLTQPAEDDGDAAHEVARHYRATYVEGREAKESRSVQSRLVQLERILQSTQEGAKADLDLVLERLAGIEAKMEPEAPPADGHHEPLRGSVRTSCSVRTSLSLGSRDPRDREMTLSTTW